MYLPRSPYSFLPGSGRVHVLSGVILDILHDEPAVLLVQRDVVVENLLLPFRFPEIGWRLPTMALSTT